MKKQTYVLEMQKDKGGNPLYKVSVDEDCNVIYAELWVDQSMAWLDFTDHLQSNFIYFKDDIEAELAHQKLLARLGKKDSFDVFDSIFGKEKEPA